MAEIAFNGDQLIVYKTDIHGKITYGNRLLLKLAGFGLT